MSDNASTFLYASEGSVSDEKDTNGNVIENVTNNWNVSDNDNGHMDVIKRDIENERHKE